MINFYQKSFTILLAGIVWVGCSEDSGTINFTNNTGAFVDVVLNGQKTNLDPHYQVSYFRSVGTKADYSVTIKVKPGTDITWSGTSVFKSEIQEIPINIGPEYFLVSVINLASANYGYAMIKGDKETAYFNGSLASGKTTLGYYLTEGNQSIIVRTDSTQADAFVFVNGVDYVLDGPVNRVAILMLK